MQSTGPSATLAQTPSHLGRYTVLARLGAGGMAEVLLGYLEGAAGFGRYVAVLRGTYTSSFDAELATDPATLWAPLPSGEVALPLRAVRAEGTLTSLRSSMQLGDCSRART